MAATVWKTALGKNLQELRLLFCQQSAPSQGLRDFVAAHYVDLKKTNPKFPILIREAAGAEARVVARYDFGVEKQASVNGLSAAQVEAKIVELVKAGETMKRSTESQPL